MVDFAANFTIRLSKIVLFTWKVLSLKVIHLPIACGLAISFLFIAQVPTRC